MTRAAFLDALRAGLAGLPQPAIEEIIADYDAHFAEGAAEGRGEDDIARALGDPTRLARELRAEAGLKRWEARRSPSSAAAAIVAMLGLGAIDIIILLPVLLALGGALFGSFCAVAGVIVAGGAVFAVGPFAHPPGGPFAALLLGLGMMAAAVSAGAVLTMLTIGLVNAAVWYGRLHYRLLDRASGSDA
jgi:uncharacterized membrane protein